MRILVLAAALLGAGAAAAKPAVALDPYAGGLTFSQAPGPLAPDHPLYHRVALAPLAGMPDRVGALFNRFADPKEVSGALHDALAGAGMAADAPAAAKARLTVTWLGLEAPIKIGFSSHATARIRYALTRVDNGQTIFARDIVTEVKAKGGDGAKRLQGTARAAIAANIASAIFCLDKAAYGQAPADCALGVSGRFDAPIHVPRMMPIFIRRH
jgi:hypothetical protein